MLIIIDNDVYQCALMILFLIIRVNIYNIQYKNDRKAVSYKIVDGLHDIRCDANMPRPSRPRASLE